MIKTSDKYILRIFSLFFLAILVMGLSCFVGIDAIPLLTRYNPSLEHLFLYYFYYSPEIFLIVTPPACAIACFLCFSQLSKKKELLAFFSFGMSFKRICRPLFLVLLLISVSCLWISDKLIPHFGQKKDYIYFTKIKKTPNLYSSFSVNKIWYRSFHIFFNIENLNLRSFTAQNVTLYYFNRKNWLLSQITQAQEVKMKEQLWTLRNGRTTIFIPEADFPLTKSFSKKVITMDESLKDLKSSSHPFENMNLKQMWKFIKKNHASGLSTIQQRIVFYRKISFNFTPLSGSSLILPLALSLGRPSYKKKKFSKGFLCLLLSAFYWIFFLSLVNLGKNEILPPFLATWSFHFLSLGMSLFLFIRQK